MAILGGITRPNLLLRQTIKKRMLTLCLGPPSKSPTLPAATRALTFKTQVDRSNQPVVDLRSDTVSAPTRSMLECALHARTGDDVFGEDRTVLDLQAYAADLFKKESALYLPTCTMANLVAILSHCHGRASEIIVGSNSHINLYEGGNAANLGGVSSRQLREDEYDATLSFDDIRNAYHRDDDDHFARTSLICIENSHNVCGGVAVSKEYVDDLGRLAFEELNIPLHVDGEKEFIFHPNARVLFILALLF